MIKNYCILQNKYYHNKFKHIIYFNHSEAASTSTSTLFSTSASTLFSTSASTLFSTSASATTTGASLTSSST